MKKFLKYCQSKTVEAFTLVEMLIVLIIISVLLLLFVPNLSQQKENVAKTGNAAVVKVVEAQAELYELNHEEEATLVSLKNEGQITAEQIKAYNDYYAKNGGTPTVN